MVPAVALIVGVAVLQATPTTADPGDAATPTTLCDYSDVPGAVWWGSDPQLTLEQLALSMAPVLWFSPDEPLLGGAEGEEITIPTALPFDAASGRRVLYYQVDDLVASTESSSGASAGASADAATGASAEASPVVAPADSKGARRVAIAQVRSLQLTYFAYFPSEVGLGAHAHDVEPVTFRAVVLANDAAEVVEHAKRPCSSRLHLLIITRVTGKAHGLVWYWNVADTDVESRFPICILVEEGKHALATDRNCDGYFSPGFDVTEHPNDAWGVRDVIRGGALFTGAYESWMTKVRRPEDRVLPPLPEGSLLQRRLALRHAYEAPHAVYELRPLPPLAAVTDPALRALLADKVVEDWPVVTVAGPSQELEAYLNDAYIFHSLAVSFRADGELGFALAVPFLVVRNVEIPLTGGFVVWRLYFEGRRLRTFGLTALYTPSASRWMDSYLSLGAELGRRNESDTSASGVRASFVLELGLKLRFNLSRSPLGFLSFLTDFWGVRLGVKNTGFFDVTRLGYVIEVGAGAW